MREEEREISGVRREPMAVEVRNNWLDHFLNTFTSPKQKEVGRGMAWVTSLSKKHTEESTTGLLVSGPLPRAVQIGTHACPDRRIHSPLKLVIILGTTGIDRYGSNALFARTYIE